MNEIQKITKTFNRLKKREQILIVFLVIAITGSLYYKSVYSPMEKKIRFQKSQLKKNQSRLSELMSMKDNRGDDTRKVNILEAECENILQDIRKISRLLPRNNNVTQVINEMTRLTKDMDFVSLKRKMDTAEELSEFFIEFRCNTEYGQIVRYIQNLETISPFLKIRELEIDKQDPKLEYDGLPIRIVFSCLLGEGVSPESLRTQLTEDPWYPNDKIFRIKKRVGEQIVPDIELNLAGITFSSRIPTAIINDDIVRIGSKIGSFTVKDIQPGLVLLNDGDNEFELWVNH